MHRCFPPPAILWDHGDGSHVSRHRDTAKCPHCPTPSFLFSPSYNTITPCRISSPDWDSGDISRCPGSGAKILHCIDRVKPAPYSAGPHHCCRQSADYSHHRSSLPLICRFLRHPLLTRFFARQTVVETCNTGRAFLPGRRW